MEKIHKIDESSQMVSSFMHPGWFQSDFSGRHFNLGLELTYMSTIQCKVRSSPSMLVRFHRHLTFMLMFMSMCITHVDHYFCRSSGLPFLSRVFGFILICSGCKICITYPCHIVMPSRLIASPGQVAYHPRLGSLGSRVCA